MAKVETQVECFLAQALTVRREAGVAHVVIEGPPRNELGFRFFAELAELLDDFLGQRPVRGVILSGRGRHFSAGSNVQEIFDRLDRLGDEAWDWRQQHVDLLDRLARLPCPVVAAIGGVCLGSALELALACDYRLAADNALLGSPEAQYGLLPGCGGTQRLPRLIGHARALEMILSGEPVDAQRAARWGLVDAVVPRKELLRQAQVIVERLTASGVSPDQRGGRCASR